MLHCKIINNSQLIKSQQALFIAHIHMTRTNTLLRFFDPFLSLIILPSNTFRTTTPLHTGRV